MVLLASREGSKVVTVACPQCGRISRQILRNEYQTQPSIDLRNIHTCPVCGMIYSALTFSERATWSMAFDCYIQKGEQSYNNEIKATYLSASKNVSSPVIDITVDMLDKKLAEGTEQNISNAQTATDDLPKPVGGLQTQPTDAYENIEEAIAVPIATPFHDQKHSNVAVLKRKIEHWKKQLLDLSKRNRMINYRETKRATLRILEPEFTELFNRLAANEEELSFQRPIDKDSDLRTFSMLSLLESLSYPIPVHVGDIKTDGSLLERRISLNNLRSKSKLARDEQGTNILYLSFGFIEWRESNTANAPWLKSPVLMMPVSLKLESIQAPYTLSRYDDDIEVNPTLDYLFNERYDIDLPNFELNSEESIEQYMRSIEEIVDQHGWKLTREVSLGLLSFLKISMYHDLDNNYDRMLKNPVIRAITGDTTAVNNIPIELNNFDSDRVSPKDCYQVVNSDSSQQEAILFSKAGASFVMQGPPGTGKSQTITNIIAEALADGKKVLFVSEKAAALQVVYKRLSEVGLDDFCLALHSHKANKKEILDSIAANLKLPHKRIKDSVMFELDELFHDRQSLNQYVQELHDEILPLEKSLYDVFGELSLLQHVALVPFTMESPEAVSLSAFNTMLYRVGNYAKTLTNLGVKLSDNPWRGTVVSMVTQNFKDSLFRNVSGLDDALLKLDESLSNALTTFHLNDDCTWNGALRVISLLSEIERLPLFPISWVNDELRKKLINEANQARNAKQAYYDALNVVLVYLNKSFFNEDLESWLNAARQSIEGIKQISGKLNLADSEILCFAADYDNYAKTVVYRLDTIDNAYVKGLAIFPLKIGDTLEDIESFGKVANQFLSIAVFCRASSFQICEIEGKAFENFAFSALRTKSEIQKYNDLLNSVSVYLYESALNEDLSYWLNSTRKIIANIRKIDDKLNLDDDVLLGTAKKHNDFAKTIIAQLESVVNAFEKGITILPLKTVDTFEDIEVFSRVASELISSPMVNRVWFDAITYSRAKQFLLEARGHAEALSEKTKIVLLEWEDTAFSIDADAMLIRFKTKYTSFFKILKSSYRFDMKTIRSVSKKVGIKIADNEAVALLQLLKDINTEKKWFSDNTQLLNDTFGSFYFGAQSDWEMIDAGLSYIEKLHSVFPQSIIPQSIVDLVCDKASHADKYSSLSDIVAILSEAAMQKIKNELSSMISDCATRKVKEELLPCVKKLEALSGELLALLKEIETHSKQDIPKGVLLKTVADASTVVTIKKRILDTYIEDLHRLYPQSTVSQTGVNTIRELAFNAAVCSELEKIVPLLDETIIKNIRADVLKVIPNCVEKDVRKELLPNMLNLTIMSDELSRLMQMIDRHSNQPISKERILDIVFTANSVIQAKKDIMAQYEHYSQLFGSRFEGLDSNWDAVIYDLDAVAELFAMPESKFMSYELIHSICDSTVFRSQVSGEKAEIQLQVNSSESAFKEFNKLFSDDTALADTKLADVSKKVSLCLGNIILLDHWISCIETKTDCDMLGLSNVTSKIEQYDNTLDDVTNVFKKGFYTLWVQAVIGSKKSVEQFHRHAHDERIRRFVSSDEKQLLIAQERIKQKVINNIPDANRVLAANDELSILQREIGKKRKIMPLRKLFKSIPNLLLRLKPCMMMSPLSVAYFLEAQSYEFDMIIFDEASQIFPQDAIGSIFRGKQVIIAGDSKQLPPTNFFAASTSNDDDYDSEYKDEAGAEIYDSILEEAAGVLLNRTLLWHYRSKHENLIAFSNQGIYKNELVTFPSSIDNANDFGVEFVFVENGIYEGKGRNTSEARRCVQLVKDHIARQPDRSLGIIAFSESQQKAILFEIQKFREQNPQYENFFVENKEDEFFVKNLENVQGDERDTIIFSVSYAKTKEQRDNNHAMSLRFGPLGMKGGERRLNVAITRAKCNIKLVSSILPSDIDLSRTESEGIKMLRSYIEFAMNGSVALQTVQAENERDTFVDIVAEFLIAHGYSIKKCVGCSDYKIDIAVVHPQKETCFVAGIECDGFSYAAAKNARDRDHLRKSVLEAMGWSIYRVWSPEWMVRQEIEGEKLLNFIETSIRDYSAEIRPEMVAQSIEDITPEVFVENIEPEKMLESPSAINAASLSNPFGFSEYVEAVWFDTPGINQYGEGDRIAEEIKYIVGIEQPIIIDLLYQRMAGAFGNQKATAPVRNAVDKAMRSSKLKGLIFKDKDGFVMVKGFNDLKVRVPSLGSSARQVNYISLDEIGLAMTIIASQAIGLTSNDLIDATVKALGYARKGERMLSCMNNALDRLIRNGRVKLVDGKIHVMGGENRG